RVAMLMLNVPVTGPDDPETRLIVGFVHAESVHKRPLPIEPLLTLAARAPLAASSAAATSATIHPVRLMLPPTYLERFDLRTPQLPLRAAQITRAASSSSGPSRAAPVRREAGTGCRAREWPSSRRRAAR